MLDTTAVYVRMINATSMRRTYMIPGIRVIVHRVIVHGEIGIEPQSTCHTMPSGIFVGDRYVS